MNNNSNKILPLCYDESSKMMFYNNKHLEPLAFLLSCCLEKSYEEVLPRISLVTNYIPNNHLGEKKTSQDIVLKLTNKDDLHPNIPDTKIIIEFNRSYEKNKKCILERNLFYLCEYHSIGLKKNQSYDLIEPSILININNFYLDEQNIMINDLFKIQNTKNFVLSENIKIINVNIAFCHHLWYINNVPSFPNIYTKNLFYLSCAMYTDDKNTFNNLINKLETNENVKKIIKEVSTMMNKSGELYARCYDPVEENQRIMDSVISEYSNKAYTQGALYGLEKGRTEGLEKGQREFIINMYKDHLSLDTICKYANVTKDKVQSIINTI